VWCAEDLHLSALWSPSHGPSTHPATSQIPLPAGRLRDRLQGSYEGGRQVAFQSQASFEIKFPMLRSTGLHLAKLLFNLHNSVSSTEAVARNEDCLIQRLCPFVAFEN
jgi:hypothetical protein